MTKKSHYPFDLVNAFFIVLHFDRERILPNPMEMPIEIQIKVIDKDFPRIQVNLRTINRDQSPLKLELELVGLFDYIGDNPEKDRGLISDFVREKGLCMLWPYLSQIARMITGQMGMNPIEMRMPKFSDLPPIPIVEHVEVRKKRPPEKLPE